MATMANVLSQVQGNVRLPIEASSSRGYTIQELKDLQVLTNTRAPTEASVQRYSLQDLKDLMGMVGK